MTADKVFRLRGEKSYSQARRVGNLLFIAGTVSWDDDFNVLGEGNFEAQIANIYKDIGRTLDHFGLDASALVKETVYTRDMDALITINHARMAAFDQANPPASTWIAMDRLANPKLLVEVEAVAVMGGDNHPPVSEKTVFHLRETEAAFGYSQAVTAGPLLFLSGTVCWDENGTPLHVGNFAAQLDHVYREIDTVLEAHGLRFEAIVEERIFSRDMTALVAAAPVRAEHYRKTEMPASTWIEVQRLVHPDLLVEVDIVAELH